VRLQGDLFVDNGDALRRVACLGHGIVCLPTYLVGDDLRAGRLVRILPDALELEASLFAVYPHSRHLSPKVRALIDFLAESLGPEPEWDGFDVAERARRAQRPRRGKGSR
jgi:DNA-binding transcriptional LysR family regulator